MRTERKQTFSGTHILNEKRELEFDKKMMIILDRTNVNHIVRESKLLVKV